MILILIKQKFLRIFNRLKILLLYKELVKLRDMAFLTQNYG